LCCEQRLSRAAIVVTLVAFGNFLLAYGTSAGSRVRSPAGLAEAAAFLAIVAVLGYGGLVFLCARLGYMRRRSQFRHASSDELNEFTEKSDAAVSILVPSYKEEVHVVRQTLLSAALQDYPNRRVALLIDDPPNPSTN
jgi:cellulose synthase/poly-beta-1,6-N-acetylglucosamine synthase-like glycosyltransferase